MAGVERRREIREAVRALKARCLHQAATWAAELLLGLPTPSIEEGSTAESRLLAEIPRGTSTPSSSILPRRLAETTPKNGHAAQEFGQLPKPAALVDEGEDSDAVILGRLYLEGKEYRRAAHMLREEKSSMGFFLRNYALLLAGEKRREEESLEQSQLQPAKAQQPVNGELPGLVETLKEGEKGGGLDAFGLFLYGLVLVKRDQKKKATDMLCRSLNEFPLNWSAWLELQGLATDTKTYEDILQRLKPHWARSLWEVSCLVELHRNEEGLERCAELAEAFPQSLHLVSTAATAKYNLRDFDPAEQMFEELLKRDPYRIEGMDTYSNILYVKEKFAALSHLAHQLVLVDKYRPETCCVIGNYFSLKGRHERAVVYFRRALKLNQNYLSAWTLMGHEFVEMKNTPAAIEAYRNAVDINPRDYRAWYGLGQTYEILALPYYALYYYRKATQLRPQDARMWCALGQCYESEQGGGPVGSAASQGGGGQQARVLKAIKCYEQAHRHNDADGIALYKLAKLHESLGRVDTAALYFKKNLDRLDSEEAGGPELVEALLFLGNFHRNSGELDLAEQYCSRLLDFSGPAKEEAKALLRDIKSLHQHQRQARHLEEEELSTPLRGGQQGAAVIGREMVSPAESDELEGFEEDGAMDLGETP